jgi:hypothetical protein
MYIYVISYLTSMQRFINLGTKIFQLKYMVIEDSNSENVKFGTLVGAIFVGTQPTTIPLYQ